MSALKETISREIAHQTWPVLIALEDITLAYVTCHHKNDNRDLRLATTEIPPAQGLINTRCKPRKQEPFTWDRMIQFCYKPHKHSLEME